MTTPIKVDIWSDVQCPWCYIGKRRIEGALALYAQRHPDRPQPEVRWHPFQLNPGLPADGMDRGDYMRRKFGSADTARVYTNVKRAAAAVGLELAIEAIPRQPSTLRPHALLEEAARAGVQDALSEALFVAYFQQGRDLSDEAVLRDIAQSAGLDGDGIERALGDASAHDQIAQADIRAREAGITGVPCFIINRRSAVSGAQGAPAILEAMELEGETASDPA